VSAFFNRLQTLKYYSISGKMGQILAELTPGVDFTNILGASFMRTDSKGKKRLMS